MIRSLALLALLPIAACGAVTPGGLVAASRLDPLATPPGDIAIALDLPSQLRLADGDATLRLAFRPEGAAVPSVEEIVPLAIMPAVAAEAETRRVVAEIAPGDRARIAEAQAAIGAAREAGARGEGSLTVAVTGGCLEGPLGDALPVSTWIRTSPDATFVRLTRARDAFGVLEPDAAAALRARLAPCPD